MQTIQVTGDVTLALEIILEFSRTHDDAFWVQSFDPSVVENTGLVVSGDVLNLESALRGNIQINVVDFPA